MYEIHMDKEYLMSYVSHHSMIQGFTILMCFILSNSERKTDFIIEENIVECKE